MLSRYLTRTLWRSTLPQPETVSLLSRDMGDTVKATYTVYLIHHAQRKPSEVDEERLDGAIAEGLPRLRWVIWQDALSFAQAPAPRIGDQIRDSSGTIWRVQKVANKLFGNEWVCECQQVPG